MKEQINFNKPMQAVAMSKSPSQSGIIINDEYRAWSYVDTQYTQTSYADRITLYGVNTKDKKQTSYLQLQIPKENLEEFIDALKKFL